MSKIIDLANCSKPRKPCGDSFNPIAKLKQKSFKRHELRAIGDIQSSLVSIGFSRDPVLSISATPYKDDVNNMVILKVDVHNRYYQAIFGEFFEITIAKFENDKGRDIFKMETPLHKSSGTFGEVIRLIQTFINTNLKPDDGCVRTLVARN
jgi:hypothetical protein